MACLAYEDEDVNPNTSHKRGSLRFSLAPPLPNQNTSQVSNMPAGIILNAPGVISDIKAERDQETFVYFLKMCVSVHWEDARGLKGETCKYGE